MTDLNRIAKKQIDTHFQHIPVMAIAPSAGAIFSTWVLWHAVDRFTLLMEVGLVVTFSVIRLFFYFCYRTRMTMDSPKWAYIAISTSFVSGCIWGSWPIFLFPPDDAAYESYQILMFSLMAVAPSAALAGYRPAFIAFFFPCVGPFLFVLIFSANFVHQMTGVLLIMLSMATISFAMGYYKMLYTSFQMQQQLEYQNDLVARASLEKSKFLAAASHDLRQPLQALEIFTTLLRNRLTGEQSRATKDYLANLELATCSLRVLLDGTLDISRLDAGAVDVDVRSFRLDELFDSLFHTYQGMVVQKGLEFRYVATRLWVKSDRVLLERILRNLLLNAIQYTPTGKILLGCRRRNDQVEIIVADSGIGIKQDEQKKVFGEFFQGTGRPQVNYQGTGLGLSIVHRLCLLLGHRIDLQSFPNRGTIISILVPSVDLSDRPDDDSYLTTIPDLNGYHLAVLENDPLLLSGYVALLENWGAQVSGATNLLDLKTKVSLTHTIPNIIIADYHLGAYVNGPESIAELYNEWMTEVPAIVLTGETSQDVIAQLRNSKMKVLYKPVHPIQLYDSLMENLFPESE